MDEAWLFLKDYPAIVPGVEGKRGVNTALDMRELTPEDQADARMPVRTLSAGFGGLVGGLGGAALAGPFGAVVGAGLGAGFGGLVGQARLPLSIRQRQAQFQAQQRKFRQQKIDWSERQRRVQSGTDKQPPGWEHGPKFELGRQQYDVDEHLWEPGKERQLFVGRPENIERRCKKCSGADGGCANCDWHPKGKITEPRDIFDKPEHLTARKYPVPGRTLFGPGGYTEGLSHWFNEALVPRGSGDKDKAAADKAAFLDKKFRKNGWLTGNEMKFLQNWYATMSPMLVGGAADRLGLIRQKKEKASKEEKAEDAETKADNKKEAAKRLKTRTGKLPTKEVAPEWYENFPGWSIEAKSGGYSESAHNVRPDTYTRKMKEAHKKGFKVEAPVSGEDELDDFVLQKLFGGAKQPSKYWTTMRKVMPWLNQENMVNWLRSHPGWEDKIPDDFEWKDLDKLKERLMKRERKNPPPRSRGGTRGVGSSSGMAEIRGSDDRLHEVDPVDSAWAVLKLG